MRILEQKKIPYISHCYLDTGAISGKEVAEALEEDPQDVYKTLVTIGKTGEYFVFVIPVLEELDLKKAAKSVGEKNIEMIKSKDLLKLTGYIHGGCSPFGMKKPFGTVFHKTIENNKTMYVSAGKVGFQVEIDPKDIGKAIKFECKDIV